MNHNIFPELKNVTKSKQRVMKNVLQELENTSRTRKHKLRYVLLSTILTVCTMFLVLNEISIKNKQITSKEQSPTEMHSDLLKPTFSNKQGHLYLHGITLGDSKEKVIERLGGKYLIEQEDGSGADFVMEYDGVARFYIIKDKVNHILLMKVDKKYFDQLFANYEGFKFGSSSDDRFIYSEETVQIIKATTNVPNQDLYLYLTYPGPELRGNPEFLKMEQKNALMEKSESIFSSLENHNWKEISDMAHPEGIVFSLFADLGTNSNEVILSKEELIVDDQQEIVWGADHSGRKIIRTKDEFVDGYLFKNIYQNEIDYNTVTFDSSSVESGGVINTISTKFPDAIYVEYYSEASEEEYDWQALRFVFREYEGEWLLFGIVRDVHHP
ncbi:hypothetical protein [Fredinandcohnia quinoae]|uniref:Uncharacterized protein n=1 Tax=Fredinandcohnia quinoae TaxID=2918902 RepID=A0AAW5E2C8_9BACI|nr:hypothetical protein [Fredinandcohnia sp. SECRCQ15]MCH1626768.1 hypothetical protein [Fredinandcohnia sp. SECRCQ15]